MAASRFVCRFISGLKTTTHWATVALVGLCYVFHEQHWTILASYVIPFLCGKFFRTNEIFCILLCLQKTRFTTNEVNLSFWIFRERFLLYTTFSWHITYVSTKLYSVKGLGQTRAIKTDLNSTIYSASKEKVSDVLSGMFLSLERNFDIKWF